MTDPSALWAVALAAGMAAGMAIGAAWGFLAGRAIGFRQGRSWPRRRLVYINSPGANVALPNPHPSQR